MSGVIFSAKAFAAVDAIMGVGRGKTNKNAAHGEGARAGPAQRRLQYHGGGRGLGAAAHRPQRGSSRCEQEGAEQEQEQEQEEEDKTEEQAGHGSRQAQLRKEGETLRRIKVKRKREEQAAAVPEEHGLAENEDGSENGEGGLGTLDSRSALGVRKRKRTGGLHSPRGGAVLSLRQRVQLGKSTHSAKKQTKSARSPQNSFAEGTNRKKHTPSPSPHAQPQPQQFPHGRKKKTSAAPVGPKAKQA